MKKILYIITHLEMGGAQKHLLSLLRNLNRDDFRIYLYAGPRGFLRDEFERIPGINIVYDRFLIREINPFFDIVCFLKMFIFMRRIKFDIVHTHSPKASVLGRGAAFLAGIKNIVYTVHGWPFHHFMPKGLFYLLVLIEKVAATITKTIIVVSRYDLFLANKYRIVPRGGIKLIHYGIQIEKYQALVSLRKNEIFFPLIITVGSLKRQKGLFDFIEAAKLIRQTFPRSRFLIIGGGPQRKKLMRRIKKEGLNNRIVLPGWLKDLRPLYRYASLFLLTSLWEGLPLSLMEAVFCGIPAVVTDTGGIKDIAQGISSICIVGKGDVSGLAESAINILKNYPYFSKIAKRASRDIDSHYWSEERQQQEMEALYVR